VRQERKHFFTRRKISKPLQSGFFYIIMAVRVENDGPGPPASPQTRWGDPSPPSNPVQLRMPPLFMDDGHEWKKKRRKFLRELPVCDIAGYFSCMGIKEQSLFHEKTNTGSGIFFNN